MNRWLAVVALVLLVLVAAMGFRQVAVGNSASAAPVLVAHGTGPVPPTPWEHGTGPVPPLPK